jgi:hypothetical protein
MKQSLKEIFYSHEGKLIHKWDHYFDIYEKYFSKYVDREVSILEIGVSHGGSLQLWKKYFGNRVKIYGVDINAECKKLEEENITIFIGSQDDASFLRNLKTQIPQVDILIDDGGHTMTQQITTFNELYDHVKDGGIYLCEDTHTSYWYSFHGGLRKKSSFIEFSKRLIDKLYTWHLEDPSQLPVDYFVMNTKGIHFYDSIVVLEKGKREKPFHLRKGEETITTREDPTLKKNTIFRKIRHFFSRKKSIDTFWQNVKDK